MSQVTIPRRPAPKSGAEQPEGEPAELTPEQLDVLRAQLEAKRASLLAAIDEKRGEERDQGREVGDEMDEASLEGSTSMTSRLLERDVQMLREIDRALAKLQSGMFGTCEGTGEPIGYERLLLRPWA